MIRQVSVRPVQFLRCKKWNSWIKIGSSRYCSKAPHPLGLLSSTVLHQPADLVVNAEKSVDLCERIRKILHARYDEIVIEEKNEDGGKMDVDTSLDMRLTLNSHLSRSLVNEAIPRPLSNVTKASNMQESNNRNDADKTESILNMKTDLHKGYSNSIDIHLPRLLDALSNYICLVIDMAEFLRHVHDDAAFIRSAEKAYTILSSYINQLNRDTKIYLLICSLIRSNLFDIYEDKTFLLDMKREYEKEGIWLSLENEKKNLTSNSRGNDQESSSNDILAIQDEINEYESIFMRNITEQDNKLFIVGPIKDPHAYHRYLTWLQRYVSHASTEADYLNVSSNKHICNRLLSSIDDQVLREQIWIGSSQQPEENRTMLGNLIKSRQQLADILGYKNYSEKILAGKFVYSTSEEVIKFLDMITNKTQSKLDSEVQILFDLKQELIRKDKWSSDIRSQPIHQSQRLQLWDLNYLMATYKTRKPSNDLQTSSQASRAIKSYLRLDICIKALVQLTSKLFDVEISIIDPVPRNECWTSQNTLSNGILKLQFSKEGPIRDIYSDNYLGTVYLDLFNREGKFNGAGHFTIQCGCETLTSETISSQNVFDSLQIENQKPVIALSLNLNRDYDERGMPCLSLYDLETLYHEWGHAMHSIMSRTKYQHLSGTRCPVDFAEIPSHLFEYFARSPEIIAKWAYNPNSNSIASSSLVEDALQSREIFQAIEVQRQVLFSAVDQHIFGSPCRYEVIRNKSSEDIYHRIEDIAGDLQDQYTSFLEQSSSSQKSFMSLLTHSHFINYGGSYYSYLFAKMYAAQIWEKKFRQDPWSRASGELLMNNLLRYGGSKPSMEILSQLTGPLDPKYYLDAIDGRR